MSTSSPLSLSPHLFYLALIGKQAKRHQTSKDLKQRQQQSAIQRVDLFLTALPSLVLHLTASTSSKHNSHTSTMGRSSGLEFCCCAIPLVNFGAYFLVLEFFFVALVTAILSLGTPSIVAGQTVIPSFSKYLIFIIALISLFWQPLGLFSIAKQRTKLYRFYIRINFLLTIVEIVLAAVFFIVAAVQHNKAKENCNNLYGNTPSSTNSNSASLIDVSTALNGTGEQICNYFIWAQVGAMGLLLVLMGLTQVSTTR